MKKVGLDNTQTIPNMEQQLLQEQAMSILQESLIDHAHKVCDCNWQKEKEGLPLRVADICYAKMWSLGLISNKDVVEDS